MKLARAARKFLKIVVSLGLMVLILSRVDLQKGTQLVQHSEVLYWILAILITFLAVVISAYKWQLILLSQGLRIPMRRLFSFYLVGLFFNNFLPTNIGGDAVRAYNVSRSTGRTPEAIASVVAERVLASVSLGFIALIGVFISYRAAAQFLSWVVALFVLSVGLLILFLNTHLVERFLNRARLLNFFDLKQKLVEAGRALQAPLRNQNTFISVLLLSLVFQILVVAVNLAVLGALGIRVSAVYPFIFVPIISALSLLPISINGLGIREGGYIYFFSQVGVSTTQAVATSLGFFFAVTIVSLMGGVILAFRK